MVAEFRLMSADEFLAQADPDVRAELIDGEVIVSAEPTPRHQLINFRVPHILQPIADDRGLGRWFSQLNLRISSYNVLSPDLLFYRPGTIPDLDTAYTESLPEIVVEIGSPSTRAHDNVQKRARYAEARVAEYWLIEPARRSIRFNILPENGVYAEVEMLSSRIPMGIFEGVHLDLAYIFGDRDTPGT